MRTVQNKGFTLIELLTVIAIIGILAGLVAVGAPRALERAKLADVDGDFNALRATLVDYSTEHTSLPIPYGGRTQDSKGLAIPLDETLAQNNFEFNGYMALLGQHNAFEMYDRFGQRGFDTDGDNVITLLEHHPVTKNGLDDPLYFGGDPALGLYEEQRPYVYIAVNSGVFKRFRKAIQNNFEVDPDLGDYWDGETWPPNFRPRFPVPSYDEAVLISMGPFESGAGIVTPPQQGGDASAVDSESRFLASYASVVTGDSFSKYDALALRAFYLATVDRNQNGVLDYDFYARTREKEADALSAGGYHFLLPDGTNGPGPVIFHYK